MAKGTTYWDWATALAGKYKELANARTAGDKSLESKISNDIQIMRYKAYIDGIDLYELHRDTYYKAWGKYPTDEDFGVIYKQLEEIPLWKQLVDCMNRYATAPAWERDNIHQEGQLIRMKIYAMGLDVNIFSERAAETYHGRPVTADEKALIDTFVADVIQQYNALNAEQKQGVAVQHSALDKKRPKVSPFSFKDRFGETYSGADMSVYMAFPGYKPLWIGTASTVSYTVYREKKQVRTMGRVSAKGITKGPRTISGRLIFTVIAEHIVESLRREIPYLRSVKTLLMDELPPFDLLVSFGNEYGSGAGLVIQGITTVDEQKTMSVEDLFTENIFTYLARALEPMRDMHTTNISEPYDPLSWYTSDWRHPYSEAMAKFKVENLLVYKESLLLTDPTPFLGGPEEWDSEAAPTMDVASSTSVGGSNSGSSGGSGSGWDGRPKIIVYIYDGNSAHKTPLVGATVVVGAHTLTTNADGQAIKTFAEKWEDVAITPSMSGYEAKADSKKTVDLNVEVTYVTLPLYKVGGVESEDACSTNPELKKYVGEVRPTGYWYDHSATTHYVVPTKNDGKDPQYYPNPSVITLDSCGNTMASIQVHWDYNITNWDSVKDNGSWEGWLKSLGGLQTIDKKSGRMVSGLTNVSGVCTMPDFNFGNFPKESVVEVTAKPLRNPSSNSDDIVDKKLWIKFYFQLLKV